MTDGQMPATGLAAPMAQAALTRLLTALREAGYRFTPATPETHADWVARHPGPATSLRDVFGWSQPFESKLIGEVFAPLEAAALIEPVGRLWRSRVRVASVADDLFLHSAFPTDAPHSVFLGPDTYRFVRMLRQAVRGGTFAKVIDLGAGAGVGGLALARFATVGRLVLSDVNPQALALARVNARVAGVPTDLVQAEATKALSSDADLVIGNPPFIATTGKTYSDGGGEYGAQVAREWVQAALRRLPPGGRLLLYTGAPIVQGQDALRDALTRLTAQDARLNYEEIDPDIMGEERHAAAYREVERIAAVAIDILKH
jgi:methylase of polypeptide subunit release factors